MSESKLRQTAYEELNDNLRYIERKVDAVVEVLGSCECKEAFSRGLHDASCPVPRIRERLAEIREMEP